MGNWIAIGALAVAVTSFARTSSSVRPMAASLAASICTRIEGFWSPMMPACATPGTCDNDWMKKLSR